MSPGPARWRVRFAEAAERADQVGKPVPAEAPKLSIFEPTDDRLIDAAEALELALGNGKLMTAIANEASDLLEPVHRDRAEFPDGERFPCHPQILEETAYSGIIGRFSGDPARDDVASSMQLGCIEGSGLSGTSIPARGLTIGARSPRTGPVMHPSCIGAGRLRGAALVGVAPTKRGRSSRTGPVMHPSCIGPEESRREGAIGGRSTGPNGVT